MQEKHALDIQSYSKINSRGAANDDDDDDDDD
jgi:hypothetical protein